MLENRLATRVQNYTTNRPLSIPLSVSTETVSTSSSKQDILGELIIIYPNPVTKYLFVESETEITKVILVDTLGRAYLIKNNFNKIDVRKLTPGYYTINIFQSFGVSSKKITITK